MKTKKEKALEILRAMDIYKPYTKGFDENDQVYKHVDVFKYLRLYEQYPRENFVFRA